MASAVYLQSTRKLPAGQPDGPNLMGSEPSRAERDVLMHRVGRLLVLIALWVAPALIAAQSPPLEPGVPTLVIGHRGVPGFGGENTIAGFRHAIEVGADGIELDLVLTRDRELAVIHDWSLNRLIGVEQLERAFPDRWKLVDDERTWLTRDFTMDELRRLSVVQRGPRAGDRPLDPESPELHVCSYSEAIEAFQTLRETRPDIRLYTEIKTSSEYLSAEEIDLCADLVAEGLASAGELGRPESHWLQSFDVRVMERLAARPELAGFAKSMLLSCEPGLVTSANPFVLDVTTIETERDLRQFLANEVGGRGMSIVHGWKLMWWHLLTEKGIDCVAIAHDLGLEIHAFTFRDHRFASDYEDRPILAPSEAGFGSAGEELRFFMEAGFDAIMTDTVDSALEARAGLVETNGSPGGT